MEPPLTAPTPAPPKNELREMSGIQDEDAEEKHGDAGGVGRSALVGVGCGE